MMNTRLMDVQNRKLCAKRFATLQGIDFGGMKLVNVPV